MKVVPLKGRTQLLVGSGGDDHWGYTPAIGTDEKKLA